ncbi:RidA family protein [Amorphus orientalis]|uniref:Enamine deaminase RidA (YjgF/YER057c/UK114 family) n=1 Tax=Amorphus orientalis TaxID=649198 RepID=A0AAE4AUC1_9HYPH|nr:RidA family protein [Amorphus orientalis]MDQ0317263.1 enamine deaminase RidA (YjgF/YER057c/UK114 family) [Amorphus orientalis]
MTASIIRLNPPTLPDAGAIGYSQITRVEPGPMAFISGQVAVRPNGEPAPDDLVEQTKIVGANAKAAVAAVGATMKDVVMARVYMVDLTPDRLAAASSELFGIFEGEQPSLTGVGVAALAAPDLQLEMELVVRLPD